MQFYFLNFIITKIFILKFPSIFIAGFGWLISFSYFFIDHLYIEKSILITIIFFILQNILKLFVFSFYYSHYRNLQQFFYLNIREKIFIFIFFFVIFIFYFFPTDFINYIGVFLYYDLSTNFSVLYLDNKHYNQLGFFSNFF